MDEPQEIIREIMVDWDTVLTDDFNPLHIALALNNGTLPSSDFRDMYHRLESAMEKIIEHNFKGFGDSVLSYNSFNKNNKKLLGNLESIAKICERNLNFDFHIQEITKEMQEVEYFSEKYQICRNLFQIKNTFEEFLNTEDTLTQCYQIIKCLDSIDQKDLFKIKGVYEFRKKIVEEYEKLSKKVNLNVFEFIFHNEINNSFKCVLALGGLYELENFIKVNFQPYLFNEIEEVIVGMYREKIDMEKLCWQIMSLIELVIRNFDTIIDLTLKTFKIEKNHLDFFGNPDQTYRFVCNNDAVFEIIKVELLRFIERYSTSEDIDDNFCLDSIIDDVDYNKIYENEFNIFKNIDHSKNAVTSKGRIIFNTANTYTLITSPKTEVPAMLLRYAESSFLKMFLNQKVETEYTKFKLEKNKKKIDDIFLKEIVLDKSTKRFAILNDLTKIIKIKSKKSKYDSQILKYLNKAVVEYFEKIYDDIFMSKLVILPKYEWIENKQNDSDYVDQKEIIKENITKNDLILQRKDVDKALYATSTIKDLDSIICTVETSRLYDLYFQSIKRQITVSFLYYYGLFFREGNYSGTFYLKKMIEILKHVYDEFNHTEVFEGLYESIEEYSIMNAPEMGVKSFQELKVFVSQIRILDEILAEVEFYGSLQKLYDFYDSVFRFESKDAYGKVIESKIKK